MNIKVNSKTVERDIDDLSVVNFPVMEEKRGKKTYFRSEKFGLDNIAFSLSEMYAMYFIKEVLKSYCRLEIGFVGYKIIDKFICQLPQINQKYLENLDEYLKIKPVDLIKEKSIIPLNIHLVREAIMSKMAIKIKYNSFNNEEITERCVDPYFLEIDDGCYHLIGFCHLRKSIREFRVSRIMEITVLDQVFIRPERFYEEYKAKKFNKLAGEESILLKLKFSGKAARYVQEYEEEKADRIWKNPDGSLIFERQTTMSQEIMKWVLGFGSEVEIIEPEKLKKQLCDTIQEMSKKYCVNVEK